MRPTTGLPRIDRSCRLLPGKVYGVVGTQPLASDFALGVAKRAALDEAGRVVLVAPGRSLADVEFALTCLHSRCDVGRCFKDDQERTARIRATQRALRESALSLVTDDRHAPSVVFETYHRVRALDGADLVVVLDVDQLSEHLWPLCGGRHGRRSMAASLARFAEHLAAPVLICLLSRRPRRTAFERSADMKGLPAATNGLAGVLLLDAAVSSSRPCHLGARSYTVRWVRAGKPGANEVDWAASLTANPCFSEAGCECIAF